MARADSLGASTLEGLESRFPAVKRPTGELFDEGRSLVFFPLRKGGEGKEYVVGVWGSERKKPGQEGFVGYPRAAVGTGLVVGGEAYKWVSSFLAGGKVEAKEIVNEKIDG